MEVVKMVTIVTRWCEVCKKTQKHFRGENDKEVCFICVQCDTVESLKKSHPLDHSPAKEPI